MSTHARAHARTIWRAVHADSRLSLSLAPADVAELDPHGTGRITVAGVTYAAPARARTPRAASYVVLPIGGYPDTAADYIACATRDEVEAQLVDYGYIDNPGVYAYKVMPGESPEDVIEALSTSPDPYPDYVVERGPRGGVHWEHA